MKAEHQEIGERGAGIVGDWEGVEEVVGKVFHVDRSQGTVVCKKIDTEGFHYE